MTSPIKPTASSRQPAVAGMFYPADPAELQREIRHYLSGAPAAPAAAPLPKVLIVPHAGYVYSGLVAASAYARLVPLAGRIRRVVLLGPVHCVPVRGLAVPSVARFETPLGAVEIDREAIGRLAGLLQVVTSDRAHAQEHSLEVQLPFLQQVLGRFALVPLAVGEASAAEVAEVLARLWGGEETLVVVSSDLSHYLPYTAACAADRATVNAMLALESTLDPTQACGAAPVNGLLAFARRRRLRPELLDLRNSGDTAGDRGRVVGYAALALYEADAPATTGTEDASTSAEERGPTLLAHARAAIARRLGLAAVAAPHASFLDEPGATFVTLKIERELRGCIGSLAPHRPLGEDVRANALAAAFDDPRFPPLALGEFASLEVEVSVLSPPTPIVASTSEADALRSCVRASTA
ncbi:MAG: AmmeMemoRadiSam system protein B [Burkholderiaceae bacterium]|nr:AmmeMemoRadiSam system protein B [Burkholderiaceae bacterium]